MTLDLSPRLLARAAQYLRTAAAARDAGDLDAAFENARTGAELAAKALLSHAGIRHGSDHNVAGALVQAGLWPRRRGKALSQLLGEYVRGVYAFSHPIKARDVRDALQLADDLHEEAQRVVAQSGPHG